jgi:anti-sigma-K factor RskA
MAAAAALLVAVIAGGLVARWGDGGETVLAAGELDRLGPVGTGYVELVERDGTLQIRLETADLEAEGDDFFEVWVIDTEVSRLHSLGPLRADGVYELPPGLDPEVFPIVDVSVEPLDGDPTHSGNSVLRGQLTF